VDNVANKRLASNIETITVYMKKLEIYKEFNEIQRQLIYSVEENKFLAEKMKSTRR